MILLIDNYDSFTWNLFHFLGDLGAASSVHRHDALSAAEAMALKPQAIILSPGPCDPDKAGICLDLIQQASGVIPILGVCLGHEAVGQAFGGDVIRAPAPVHGKLSPITHDDSALFNQCAQGFAAARYHSLVIDATTLPDCLTACAWSNDKLIMAVRHRQHPTFGVQFHPESIATEHGHQILKNFLDLAA